MASNYRKNHEQNRSKVCLVCFDKGTKSSMALITGVQLRRIHDFFLEDYNVNNPELPNAICSCCRKKLEKA